MTDSLTSTSRLARFDALFTDHQRHVLAYAMRRTQAPADAEDVAAETFTIAWRKLDAIPAAEPLLWLYAVARRVLANHRRGIGRRERLAALLRVGDVATPTGPDPIDRLRAADPIRADDVPAASLARVTARIQEHIVTDIQQTSTAAPGRRPLALFGGLVAAGALALAIAIGFGSNLGTKAPAGVGSIPTDNPAAGGGVASCLVYDPANLPTFDAVFDGTATAVDGDRVTFDVTTGWKGVDGSVTLTAPETDIALVGPLPDFAVGGRYLVTAAGSTINACGYTVEYDAGTAAAWAAAFGG